MVVMVVARRAHHAFDAADHAAGHSADRAANHCANWAGGVPTLSRALFAPLNNTLSLRGERHRKNQKASS